MKANVLTTIVMLLLLACSPRGQASRATERAPQVPTLATPTLPSAQPPTQAGASRFGIDYVFPLAPLYQQEVWPKTYAATGVRWVNFAQVSWKDLEPNAPSRAAHKYNWEGLDASVRLWQQYNFQIAFSTRLGGGWFAGPIRYQPDVQVPFGDLWLKNSDRLPASEHMDSYRAWISAMVERYDGDGKDDMPGLKYPVLHYQIGNEYANPLFWTGTLEDYRMLLEETRRAAQQAHPNVRIISNGIRWNDLFHADPTAQQFEKRFAEFLRGLPSDGWRAEWQRVRQFTEGTVALAGIYDILDAGGNGPYPTMSAGYMTWVRKELAKSQATTTIWDMEARSEPRLVGNPVTYFHSALDVPGGQSILQAMRTPSSAQHDQAVAWYRAEQARILAQVFVTRFAAGFEKVFMGMASDWDATLGALATLNPYIGLLDKDGKPWPAFYALKLLAEKTDGFTRAEKIASEKNVELYRFTFADGRPAVWIAWLAEGKTRGMDDPLPKRRVRLGDIKGPVAIDTIPTSGDKDEVTRVESGKDIVVELSPTPIIITTIPTTAATLDKVYLQIALNVNSSRDPTEQQQIIQTVRRHLALMDQYGVKANYYFTGLGATMIQERDPALIDLLKAKSAAKQITLAHHGANRPPRPMPIERVHGQNWEDDVRVVLQYETCALDAANGRLDCSRPGGLKNMREDIFVQPLLSTGRFFQASILYATKQFGVKMAVGLQYNTGAPRGDAWFLGMLNRPDSISIGPEMIVRWMQSGVSPLPEAERRIAALDRSRIRLASLLIHDHDFYRGKNVTQQEQVWQKYEEMVRWALARGYAIVSLEDIWSMARDDRERTIMKAELQTIAEFYVRQVEATRYPPDYIDLRDDYFSLTDAWQALVQALAHYRQTGALPEQLSARDLLGPTVLVKTGTTPRIISAADILQSAATFAKPLDRVPASVRLGQAGVEVNASEHLYLMAKEFSSLVNGRSTSVELIKINLISESVEAIRPDPNDARVERADALTKQQFWTYKPARWK